MEGLSMKISFFPMYDIELLLLHVDPREVALSKTNIAFERH